MSDYLLQPRTATTPASRLTLRLPSHQVSDASGADHDFGPGLFKTLSDVPGAAAPRVRTEL